MTPTEKKIIRDLAKRIQSQATQQFQIKKENIRERILSVMRSAWPNSNEETLLRMAATILSNEEEFTEECIFAEVREISSLIVPSQNQVKNPFEEEGEQHG